MSESTVHVVRFADKRTPMQSVVDCMEELDEAQIAVIVYLDKDGGINTSWSDGSLIKRIGMMEFAKSRMTELAIENQEIPDAS